MNRFGNILLSSLFVMFIMIFGVYMFSTNDHDISKTENRKLAQKPELTIEKLKDGSYMEEFEGYFTDQFPGRDRWLKSYIDYQRLTNKTYIFDYFITKENWIYPKPDYDIYSAEIEESTDRLNLFADFLKDKDIELYYFSVPHRTTVMSFLLPDYIKPGNYLQNINVFMSNLYTDENFVTVDLTNEFTKTFSEEELSEMYFRTDHHWNLNGAFQGYKRIVDTLNVHSDHFIDTEVRIEDYQKICSDSSVEFDGSYNKQVYRVVDESEELKCYYKSKEVDYDKYTIYLNGQEREPSQVYGQGIRKESSIVNYSDLFTYNYSELKIINERNKKLDNKILIIKDSYANPLVYQLAEHFYETTIYDPRYNEDQIIQEYIEEMDFDIVAFVYNSTHLYGKNYKFDTYPVSDAQEQELK
ncbi:alginate O-acetyltransferase AlgX-related protein [Paucisalibacillus globulus]|uniref:alginate O-acetyltransferase AlgX-related protein n=1 Tax=Paucisalibacillus globulus TaxID=351095 RepID=UPI000BB8844D|nr:hypothetical protein [Paucisalibacillus globulus]